MGNYLHSVYALAFVLIVCAIGDVIAVKTKSVVSMLFTSSVIFLIGFWSGVPQNLFNMAHLYNIGLLIMLFILIHMGTLLNIKQLMEQWKTVVIAISAIIGIAVFLFAAGIFTIGKEAAIVAAPPISGGIVAGHRMSEAAKAIGREDLSILAVLLVVVQGFVGYPLASFCLKKVGKKVLKDYRSGNFVKAEVKSDNNEENRKKLIPPIPKKYLGANVYLAKMALVAVIAVLCGEFFAKTPIPIDKNIMCLLLGIFFSELGFLEKDIFAKANSIGLGMAALLVVIFNGLSSATPEMVLKLLPIMVMALVFGVIGIAIATFIVSKVLKEDFFMAFAIGSSALFGFPGTYIVSNEVASSLSSNDEEKEAILSIILPKMLVAGFITVSIASVFLAGIMYKML